MVRGFADVVSLGVVKGSSDEVTSTILLVRVELVVGAWLSVVLVDVEVSVKADLEEVVSEVKGIPA